MAIGDELQQKKIDLEEKIKELLNDFETETGLWISYVSFDRTIEPSFENNYNGDGTISKVNMTVKIKDTRIT